MTKNNYWKDVAFPQDVADLRSVGGDGVIVPHGTTANRPPVPVNGTIRYNISTSETELFQNGSWSAVQTTALGGEINTASNLGAGQGVFGAKVGTDLRFKSLVAGSGVTLSSNTNEIIISAPGTGEANTGTNTGIGTGQVFESKFGTALQFRTLRSLSAGLTITTNGSNIDFSISGTGGEANTGSNVGTGSQVYKDKVTPALRFRSILGTNNQIAVSQSANEITIGLTSNPVIPGSGSITIPAGTTAAQPTAANGMLRYDTDANQLRAVVNGAWTTVATSTGTFLPLAGGTMTGNLTLSGGADIIGGAGATISLQGPITLTGAGAHLDMSAGGDILLQSGATVGGRDIEADGDVLDSFNPSGVFGFVSRISDPGVFVPRELTGVSGQISVTNGTGVSANPQIGLAANPTIPGTSHVRIPYGTTAERPATPLLAHVRFNTEIGVLEYYANSNWLSPLATVDGILTTDIDMGGGDILNVGQVNGQDLTNIGTIVGQLDVVTTNTGFLTKSTGGYLTRELSASVVGGFEGISVTNGDGSGAVEIGLDMAGLDIQYEITGDDTVLLFDASANTNARTRIADIVEFFGSGTLDSALDVPGSFGFLVRTADGSPTGSFQRRAITANTSDAFKGITISNTRAVAGDAVIGLNVNGLPATTSLSSADEFFVYRNGVNSKVTASTLRTQLLGGNFRASATNTAVVSGTSQVALSVGTGDFNQGNYFTSNTFTPPAGTYRLSAYLEVDSGTSAGTYTLRFRRNGVAEGNRAVIVSDATNVKTLSLDDVFVANGTDAFSLEITNSSGGAATLVAIRFFGHRIY